MWLAFMGVIVLVTSYSMIRTIQRRKKLKQLEQRFLRMMDNRYKDTVIMHRKLKKDVQDIHL